MAMSGPSRGVFMAEYSTGGVDNYLVEIGLTNAAVVGKLAAEHATQCLTDEH